MKKRASVKRRPIATSSGGSSPLDQGWPPAWSVSFSDMTTLLMTAFILWYSLTAMRVPAELLAIGSHTKIQQIGGPGPKKDGKRPDQHVFQSFKMTEQQESAIQEIKRLSEVEKEFKDYLATAKIEDAVETEVGIDSILVTPRSPLLFREGRTDLRPEGLALMEKIALVIEKMPYYQIRIEGHTDAKPISPFHRYRFPSNWELSYGRAVSIAKYFISKRIPPNRIGASGYGETKPRYPNDTEENRKKNRRVEIYISFIPPPEAGKKTADLYEGAQGLW